MSARGRIVAALVVVTALVVGAVLFVLHELREDRLEREARTRKAVCAVIGFLVEQHGPAPELAEFDAAYGCETRS